MGVSAWGLLVDDGDVQGSLAQTVRVLGQNLLVLEVGRVGLGVRGGTLRGSGQSLVAVGLELPVRG